MSITLVEAITQALDRALEEDPNVVIFGEDVGHNGGVFRATNGLQAKYGNHRVFDSPLAENMISGLAVGMSLQGIKPVAEIQFMGFLYACLDQIINHASRMRTRTRGRLSCPLVIRTPYGGGIHAPEHHSESTEALLAHIPGLRVVIPSSPVMAYGLLLAAIDDPDPVIFMEPTRMYRMIKQEVPNNGQRLPLDVCYCLREGSDVTLVSWGAMLYETLQAAQELFLQGISAEVLDVATIKPLDMPAILTSVMKTGRCVIIQESAPTCSVGSEIAAAVMEQGFGLLKAPVKRVSGYDTVMPLFRMESIYMPSIQKILQAVLSTMEYK